MPSVIMHPAIPDDSRVIEYARIGSYLYPAKFGNWRDECNSWKKTAYLSGNISTDMPCLHIKGPDAVKMMNDICVNNMGATEIGAAKHAIMCAPTGNIVGDGVALRLAEDEFGCYALQPLIIYWANSGKYDVEPIGETEKDFIYQVAGPKSLEILEQAAEEDLHDIKFMRFRNVQIAGHEVRIIRMGMAGTLGYEVHGQLEDAHDVYNAIWECGEPLGMEKLGYISYSYDHAENGIPQIGIHFMFAWKEHPELWEWMAGANTSQGAIGPDATPMLGSLVSPDRDNAADCYRNPIELGWGNSIWWDHDFCGKEALQIIAAEPHRATTSITLNPEDVLDVFASFFQVEEEPYKEFDLTPMEYPYEGLCGSQQNAVLDKEGNLVGVACVAEYSITYRKLHCLATIDENLAKEGTELVLVWGGPNDRKKNIRVTVDRYPLLDMPMNWDYDVETIPHYQG